MLKDILYAWRTLRKNPGFALTAILSIALAIGANSAIFSLQQALLLRPLAIAKPSEVVSITSRTLGGVVEAFTYPDFVELRDKNRSFDGLLGYQLIGTRVARDEKSQPDFRIGFLVSGNFFDVIGVKPALGRGFRADEDEVPGRDAVVVLSYDFWKEVLGGDLSIVGDHLRLGPGGSLDFIVIGVAPESFTGMDLFFRPSFYVPNMMGPKVMGNPDLLTDRRYTGGRNDVNVRGRLKPGVSVQAANADIAAIVQGLESAFPNTNTGRKAAVRTEMQTRVDYAPILAGIVAAVSGVMIVILAIACANVANLMLSRGRARAREISVRLAIGASRYRLIRELMAESLLIALAGGALGLFIAGGALQVFSAFEVPGDAPVRLAFELDTRVLIFTLIVSVISAILFGLFPAFQATRADLTSALKAGDLIHSRKRFFGRYALVTVQIAGSLVMLMAAAQMYRNMTKVLTENPGFLKDHRLVLRLDPTLSNYTQTQTEQFYRTLIERTTGASGFRSAALASGLPLTTEASVVTLAPEGYEFPAGQENLRVGGLIVDENYFSTLAVPIIAGRGFQPTDQAKSPRVAVVNEEFAKRAFKGSAIGKRIRLDDENREWAEIVGVTSTGKYGVITEPPTSFVYLPFSQNFRPRMTIIAETSGDPLAMAGPIRSLIRSIDPSMPIFSLRTLEDMFEHGPVTQVRVFTVVFSGTSMMGFVLALLGLYAVVAFQVTRRTREIGVRIALGAQRGQVLRMILKQAAIVAGIGIGSGFFLSVIVRPLLLVSMGRPVSSFDPSMIVGIPLSLLLITLLAATVPARRAARVDPQRALRQD
jgi:macrolide transport system ATP-binding/permease protein